MTHLHQHITKAADTLTCRINYQTCVQVDGKPLYTVDHSKVIKLPELVVTSCIAITIDRMTIRPVQIAYNVTDKLFDIDYREIIEHADTCPYTIDDFMNDEHGFEFESCFFHGKRDDYQDLIDSLEDVDWMNKVVVREKA